MCSKTLPVSLAQASWPRRKARDFTDIPTLKEIRMAKHQRSNREVRKPKADKKKTPMAQTSPFSSAPGMAKPAAGKKGR